MSTDPTVPLTVTDLAGPGPGRGNAAPKRRGPGAAVAVVVSLVILLALLLIADRVAVSWAERHAERSMTEDFRAANADVTIAGFPFLTQLVGGRLTTVNLGADSIEVDGLVFAEVSAVANGVPIRGSGTISSAAGGALIPISTLETMITGALEQQNLGNLVPTLDVEPETGLVSLQAELVGLSILGIDLTPRAAGRAIELDVTSLRLGPAAVNPEDIPFGLGDVLLGQLGLVAIDLDALPAGVELSSLSMVDDGALISLAGTDVELP